MGRGYTSNILYAVDGFKITHEWCGEFKKNIQFSLFLKVKELKQLIYQLKLWTSLLTGFNSK